MKVFSAGYSDTENVVQTTENVGQTQCRDNMEEQISHLVRVADLAMHVWLSEQGEEINDEDSTVLQIILEDIQQRAIRRHRRDDRSEEQDAPGRMTGGVQ